MIHYGTKLNQSSYTLVSDGPLKIFDTKNHMIPSIIQANNIISRLNRNTTSTYNISKSQFQQKVKPEDQIQNLNMLAMDPQKTHQYLVKKYGNNLLGEHNFNLDELIRQISDIFCIVCEQYISESKIDQHCKYCQAKPQNEVEQIESLQSKLEKCNYLISRVKKLLKIYCTDKQQVIQYLQLLWKCVTEIILASSENQVIALQGDLGLFIDFFNVQKGEEYEEKLLQQIMTVVSKISQFTERKKHLVQKNNIQEFLKESVARSSVRKRDPFQDMQNNLNLNSIKNQTLQASLSSQQFQKPSVNSKQLNKITLQSNNKSNQKDNTLAFDESYAHIEVVPEESSSESSRIQENDFLTDFFKQQNHQAVELKSFQSERRSIPRVPQNYKNVSPVRILNGQEKVIGLDKKTRFFNLAAQMKENFSLEHPAQTVLVAGLYERANRTNVLPGDYERFIMEYYNQF